MLDESAIQLNLCQHEKTFVTPVIFFLNFLVIMNIPATPETPDVPPISEDCRCGVERDVGELNRNRIYGHLYAQKITQVQIVIRSKQSRLQL